MWLGASASVSAPFRVTRAGVVTATTGTFSGTISSGTITGGTIDIGSGLNSWHVDSSGNMWIGGSTYAAAPFKISSDGSVTSVKGATFSGSIVSNGDARFDGGGGDYSYIQNDGRFQSISSSSVRAQMGQNGIFTVDGIRFGSFNTTGKMWVQGIGIVYPDTGFGSGPGLTEAHALQWDGANAYDVVNNTLLQYLGGGIISDRRIKLNIRQPSENWVDKVLNSIKIWEFDKINPLDDDDLHVHYNQIGVIADELKEIFPQFESSILLRDPDGADADKIRSVNLSFLGPVLVLIAQQFNARISELEARLGA
jgi:hypothetical protein